MTQRGRWTLALLAAALIAAAIYVSTAGRPDRPAAAGTLLYPQLEPSLDDVTAIRILGPGATTAVTVKRAKTGWQVVERSGYPADTSRVRTLLLGLAQARTLEQKTSVAANYPSLGVEDLATPGATGTGVELEGLGKPVSLIVGKSSDARSTFVRRKGEAASWQIGAALTVERDPAKWLATELLDIATDRIQSADVAVAGKRPWSMAKSSRGDSNFTVTGKPAGGSAAAPDANTERLATALAGLRLVDVRPAADEATVKPAATTTYRTFDGLEVLIEGYTDGEKRYIRVRPSVDEIAARRFFVAPSPSGKKAGTGPDSNKAPAAPATTEAPAEATSPESALAQTRAAAAKLEARSEGWSFEIPSWSYDAIFGL